MKMLIIDKLKKNTYLYFFSKILLFLAIVIFLDFTIGTALKYAYFNQKSGFLYRTTYAIDETKADVLIFGSSKANHQYYPEVFQKRLNMTYFNAGRDGSSLFYHYAVLSAVLKRYTPKVIVLDISREFEKKQANYDRLSMLLPYYATHPEMRKIIELKSIYERYKLISRIYPYNSLLFSIMAGNSEYNRERYTDIEGYVPLSRVWNKPIETYAEPVNYELDSIKINIYEEFIKKCIDAKIRLYIVGSPDFYKLNYEEKSNIVAKEIAKKYNQPFFDYSQDTLFLNNPQYFADLSHLNNEGAKIFSNKILDEIGKLNQSQESKY